jgi:ubiquinone biosynthesis protein
VPTVFHEYSTQRVLTLEHVDAIKASRFDLLDEAGLDRVEIATRITDLVMKQVFVFGFFHGDPHPGNIHILPNNVICFLDFGLMGSLDEKTRETFARFIEGIAHRDQRLAASSLLRLAKAELDPPRPGFEADVSEFMHQHFYRPVGEMVFGKLVNHLFALTSRHNLTMPPDIFTMLKALSLTESLVTRLHPGHDILKQAEPFMKQVRLRQARPQRLWRYWQEFGGDVTTLLREFPLEIRRITAQIKEGRLKLMIHHGGFEELLHTLERIVNRLSFSLVLSSLIISSSVIVHAHVPPLWHDVSVIGVAGYLLAGMMGFGLLIAMVRHGKM